MIIQTIARLVDPDILGIVQDGVVTVTPDSPWVVIDHEPLAPGDVTIVKVDGVLVTLGLAGSGSDFEYARVGATQTIIRKVAGGSKLVEVVPGAIGTFTIGSTFKIA